MSTVYHALATGSLTQDWSNAGLITGNDDWSGVPGITGYLGDIDGGSPTNVDARTRTAAELGAVDVIANQTNPNTLTNGGVAEFAIANPTVALQGSGTADAPSLVIYLDATGRQNLRVQFNARDIDGSADNATQQIAVQYRIGETGAWTNVPSGYLADATTGPSQATQTTAFDLILPEAVNNQAQVQVRILTTNAGGSDEWVGIDDIVVSSEAGAGGPDLTAPTLVSSSPADDAANVAVGADIVLTFDEAVQAGTGEITVTDGAGDTRVITLGAADPDGTVAFNGNTVTIDLAADLATTTAYDVLVAPGAIEDASGNDFAGIAADALDFTTADDAVSISAIQGNGQASALVGQTVTTQGVVTAVDSNGFYLQDPTGDGDAATSDGIFVFTSSAPAVAVGDAASVTGVVGEFTPNGAAPGFLSVTQIDARTSVGGSVTDLGVGAVVAPTLIGGPGGLLPPTEALPDGVSFYEALEGMLVTVVNPVAVGPTNGFGEIFAVVDSDNDPSNGLNATGLTDRGTILIEEGAPGFGTTNTVGGDFNPERIQIDDDSGILPGFTTPGVDAGARLESVTGVVSYNFGNYEVLATQAYGVAQASPLVKETGTLTGSADRLLIASYNAENLDPGDGAARFATIADEIVNSLNTPDIIALQEVQDNDGATNSATTSAAATLQMLVDAINTAGGPQYAFIDNPFIGDDTSGGQPGGNIRNAFLFRTDRVEFVDGSLGTIAADGGLITDPAGNTAQQTDPANPFFGSRPPLVAAFEFNGEEVTIVNNHFSSKGGSGALLGSEQPPLNGSEIQRAAQAQAVNNFVDSLLAQDADAKVIVAGDLNEFPFEEPIDVLRGTGSISNYAVPGGDPFDATADFAAGGVAVLEDLLELLPANEQYDYVFEGNAQTLDHILVSRGLSAGAQFDVVRLNAEFAVQTSDHDPLLASFEIPAPSVTFTLQLLHMADGEAGLLAGDTAPIMGALIDRFDDEYANTLILSGGDNFIPGPFLNAGTDPSLNAVIGATAPGRPDIAIHNAFGVEVSAIGNHEWDLGSAIFADSIRPAGAWEGAQFALVTANLDFTNDSAIRSLADNSLGGTAGDIAGSEASDVKGKIAPWVTVTEGGEKIGILGATTQVLERISSPTGTEVNGFPKAGQAGDGTTEVDDMDLLAAQLQPIIDEMLASGINKIILQSHLQSIANEKLLATKLQGVDIILAAGSNTRLGDADDVPATFPGHAPDFADTYPLVTQGVDGKTTLIVNTDNEYTYLGRLVVEFDANGDIVPGSLDPSINGAYAATQETLEAAYGADIDQAFAEGSKGDQVRDITEAVDAVIAAKDGTIFGFTSVYLEGERSFVRTQETNLGNLTADANAFVAREALGDGPFIVSLKNGGGIRAQIGAADVVTGDKIPPVANPDAGKPAGGVSQLDIENALRFDNKLIVFDTTPAGLLAILNHGAGLAPGNGGFPQIGGVRFSYDPDLPSGSRIQSVALIDENDNVIAKLVENGVVVAGAPSLISVVTLNFTANGGDGYPVKQNAENFRFLLNDGTLSGPIDEALNFTAPAVVPANALGEQAALAEFLQTFHGTPETAYNEADTPATEDTRIQNLNVRDDAVFVSAPILGDDGNNHIVGTAGDDVIFAGAGNDTVEGSTGDDVFKVVLEAGKSDGTDVYDGGEGFDTLDFSESTVAVRLSVGIAFGGLSPDIIRDVEKVIGTDFNDYIFGSSSDEELQGGLGNDTLDGAIGNDHLFGGEGADRLNGSLGDDHLFGGAGNDILNGGQGNDVIVGGAGIDMLTGGPGNDKFVYNDIADAGDIITDFMLSGPSEDAIVLFTGLFDGFTGDDALDLIDGGFLRAELAGGNKTLVQVDVDGGGDEWQLLAQISGQVSNAVLADHVVIVQDEIV